MDAGKVVVMVGWLRAKAGGVKAGVRVVGVAAMGAATARGVVGAAMEVAGAAGSAGAAFTALTPVLLAAGRTSCGNPGYSLACVPPWLAMPGGVRQPLGGA